MKNRKAVKQAFTTYCTYIRENGGVEELAKFLSKYTEGFPLPPYQFIAFALAFNDPGFTDPEENFRAACKLTGYGVESEVVHAC